MRSGPPPKPESIVSAKLVVAYRSAHYQAGRGATAIVLRIDQHSPQLSSFFDASGHRCALFITACNPFGLPQGDEQNQAACARLYRTLRDRLRVRGDNKATRIIVGEGRDPHGAWNAEKSFLVPGLDLEHSQALGKEFNQNAIIWIGPDAIPRLILLR